MASRNYKPTSPGRRAASVPDFGDISKERPERSLVDGGVAKSGGRNNRGRITAWHRGGGHKRLYRRVDFRREKYGVPALVARIEYDPNRSAHIALLHYADGEKRYILAPNGLKPGNKVESGPDSDVQPGNAMPLANMPMGSVIHAIELKPGKGAQMVRSAGGSAQLMAREKGYATLRLPSGEHRKVLATCMATLGQVGNVDHENRSIGKAGRNRWKGKRGNVRGVAMNPVDHPMGGGEGRTSGGRQPCTPWGVATKGYKTRSNRRTNKYIVKRRGKK